MTHPVAASLGWRCEDPGAHDVAGAAGLVCRPLEQTLTDVLDWEAARGHGRPPRAVLEPAEERRLVEVAKRLMEATERVWPVLR